MEYDTKLLLTFKCEKTIVNEKVDFWEGQRL